MPGLWQASMMYDKPKRALQEMGLQPWTGFKDGKKGNAPRFRIFSHEMEAGEHEDAQETRYSSRAKPGKQ